MADDLNENLTEETARRGGKKASRAETEIAEAEKAAKAAANGDLSAAEAYKSPYDVGPRPAEGGKELNAWRKKVKKARKILRKDLKKRGITKKGEFEQVAWEMGLALENTKRGFFLWLWRTWGFIKAHLTLKSLLVAGSLLLASVFLLSYISDSAGAFTINLTADMLKVGFVLSDNEAFESRSTRLFSEKTKNISNITLGDISSDVDHVDGPHNGENYVAYTFYIRNEGEEAEDYFYKLTLEEASMGVEEAVWIMLYEDGHQVLYTKASADGDAEGLLGYEVEPPFYEEAYDPELQYFQEDGVWGVLTTPMTDDETVVQGIVYNVEPQEVHKYTVVLWLEGNDPECTNDIFGGSAKYQMRFDVLNDDDGTLFSGLWRREYSDYMSGQVDPDTLEDSADSIFDEYTAPTDGE